MKKLLTILLALILVLSLSACGGNGDTNPKPKPTPTPTTDPYVNTGEDVIEEIRNTMDPSYEMAAVAFLGYYDYGYEYLEYYFDELGVYDEYPFLYHIEDERYIENLGNEVYCIIPTDPNATVVVNEWYVYGYDIEDGEAGDILYRSEEGLPIIIKGNLAIDEPNMQVIITDNDGNSMTYYPYLDSEYNMLMVSNEGYGVYDFTPYDLVDSIGDTYVVDFEYDDIVGEWYTNLPIDDNDYYSAYFYFDNEGNMELTYGINDGDTIVSYEGYYYVASEEDYPTGTVLFDLYVVEDYSEDGNASDIYGAYQFTYPLYEAGLYVEYVEGDYLVDDVYTPDFYLQNY